MSAQARPKRSSRLISSGVAQPEDDATLVRQCLDQIITAVDTTMRYERTREEVRKVQTGESNRTMQEVLADARWFELSAKARKECPLGSSLKKSRFHYESDEEVADEAEQEPIPEPSLPKKAKQTPQKGKNNKKTPKKEAKDSIEDTDPDDNMKEEEPKSKNCLKKEAPRKYSGKKNAKSPDNDNSKRDDEESGDTKLGDGKESAGSRKDSSETIFEKEQHCEPSEDSTNQISRSQNQNFERIHGETSEKTINEENSEESNIVAQHSEDKDTNISLKTDEESKEDNQNDQTFQYDHDAIGKLYEVDDEHLNDDNNVDMRIESEMSNSHSQNNEVLATETKNTFIAVDEREPTIENQNIENPTIINDNNEETANNDIKQLTLEDPVDDTNRSEGFVLVQNENGEETPLQNVLQKENPTD